MRGVAHQISAFPGGGAYSRADDSGSLYAASRDRCENTDYRRLTSTIRVGKRSISRIGRPRSARSLCVRSGMIA